MKKPMRSTRSKISLAISVIAASSLLCIAASAANAPGADDNINAAQKSAEAWLSLTDNHKYGESWDQAAQLFKGAITRAKWEQAVDTVRTPLGKVESRKKKSATFATELPGAPKGEYVVIQYDTSFEKQKGTVETITPMRDKDGTWRVSGYFIK